MDTGGARAFLCTLNGWRRKGGKPYLHTGRMTRPLAVTCGETQYTLDGGHDVLSVPEVLTSAYVAEGRVVHLSVT